MVRKTCCWIGILLLLLAALPGLAEASGAPTAEPDAALETPYLDALIEEADAQMPPKIQRMMEIAREELAELNREKIPRTNKYSIWYFNDQRRIGWCVTFAGWCADEAGLTMVKEADASWEISDDELFFPMEAKVILSLRAFENANRLTDIPKPGYALVYGVIGGTPATHYALVETVRPLEDGTYEITTVEGNVSDTVKRYCFRYNPTPKRKHHNMKVVPEQERLVEDAQYKLHKDNWYVVGFGQTYVTPEDRAQQAEGGTDDQNIAD